MSKSKSKVDEPAEQPDGVEGTAPPEESKTAEAAPETSATVPSGLPASRADMGFVSDIPLRLSVQVGSTRLLVREVLQLGKGSVIELDRMAGEPADLYLNGRLVGRGDITVVDDKLAIRLTDIGMRADGAEPD